MGIIYYIDSENVGDSWIDLLTKDNNSRFNVFYTGHSPRIAYSKVIQLVNAASKPEFIECYEGNNGLDFQLIAYMALELRDNEDDEMVIVSNDTGFDTVIRFLLERGKKVKRVSPSEALNTQISEVQESVSDDECITGSSSVEVTEKISGVDTSSWTLPAGLFCVVLGNLSNIVRITGLKDKDR